MTPEEEILVKISRELYLEIKEISDMQIRDPFNKSYDVMMDNYEKKLKNYENLTKSITRNIKIDEILNEDIREEEI